MRRLHPARATRAPTTTRGGYERVSIGEYIRLFSDGLVAGVAVAILCAVLSVLVVLKRLAFMGQGISHSAFGGIGISMLLGLGAAGTFGVVAGFCVLMGLCIAWIADRRTTSADTVIGVFLVGSMALGAILVSISVRVRPGPAPGWEDLLFGSLLAVGPADAAIAWIVCAAVLVTMVWTRRPLLFWAFDEASSEAFGVPGQRMKFLLMAMLAVAIVVAMKLAGVVLATALLVLPGATALRLSRRIVPVFAISILVSLIGVLGGLAASFRLDLPPGACVVAALVLFFAATWPVERLRHPATGRGVGADAAG